MPRVYRLYQVDAFTSRPFSGNPAGVVPDAVGLTGSEMLAIARELNNSETAFVFPGGEDHDVRVRFFTPTTEVPICGHATIAAHWVRAHEGVGPGVTRQLTGAGILPVETEPDGPAGRRVWMTQRPPSFEAPLEGAVRGRLIAGLGLHPDAIADFAPVQVVSTGHSKIMIPLRDKAVLDRLTPDLPALAALSSDLACNGYYPFVLSGSEAGPLSYGRMFAPAIGIAEDPVTGNASGPLGAWLVHHGVLPLAEGASVTFQARQGEAMGRPGTVTVEVSSKGPGAALHVRIAGEACIVFQTRIELPDGEAMAWE